MGRYSLKQVSKEIRRSLRLYDDTIAFYDTPYECLAGEEELTLHEIIWRYNDHEGFKPLSSYGIFYYAGGGGVVSLKEAWVRYDRTFLSRTRSIRSFKFR